MPKININGIVREMNVAELEAMQAQMPKPAPTPEERLDTLEGTTDDIILMMADLIGGGE